MSELTLESLGLKKTLDKMTAKELRQLCLAKIPSVVGASGMGKEELVAAVKEKLGIVDEPGQVSPYKEQIFTLKRTIRSLREQKTASPARKDRDILRRRINKLKKRTRRLAKAV